MNLRIVTQFVTTGLTSTLLLLAAAGAARADFQVCNSTSSRVGVSVGYKDGEGWATEGWWNIPANSCETLMRGDLIARYYYIHAIDYDNQNEAWDGPVPMCIRDSEFTIKGIDNCLARGFERKGFFEVDTGENRTWTVQLTATNAASHAAASSGQNPPTTQ
ncbi:hypothetical protein GCM10007276_14890 [Agaricicola taiwanensis]|uniref:DUF1036 domain-containing protein n=1 Tax=Agaricicola taiwanensis TaxID=591372 RepID=A0A8J2VVA4_9RHOB|nr:DUF1036 domain-containing protein [Agaricicola taiwanensis]GGE38634.1 hypothetical protein GCM10007276_14890 [Agaricicola taiwanensis]